MGGWGDAKEPKKQTWAAHSPSTSEGKWHMDSWERNDENSHSRL